MGDGRGLDIHFNTHWRFRRALAIGAIAWRYYAIDGLPIVPICAALVGDPTTATTLL